MRSSMLSEIELSDLSSCFFSSLKRFSASRGVRLFRSVSRNWSTIFCDKRSKDGELHAARRAFAGEMVGGATLGGFVFLEDFAGAVNNCHGQAGELRDFDAVALVGRARLRLCEGRRFPRRSLSPKRGSSSLQRDDPPVRLVRGSAWRRGFWRGSVAWMYSMAAHAMASPS